MRGEAGYDGRRWAAFPALYLGDGSSNPLFVVVIPGRLLWATTYDSR